jgi:hypothetical protein
VRLPEPVVLDTVREIGGAAPVGVGVGVGIGTDVGVGVEVTVAVGVGVVVRVGVGVGVTPLSPSSASVSQATKMSGIPFVSPATRFEAYEEKTTQCPSALILGYEFSPFASEPSKARETRVVCPVTRSCTKMSAALLVSPGTRLEARDLNAT